MSILIHSQDGEFQPRFVCDICKQPIDDASRGIVLFNPLRKKAKPFLVHKFTCDRAYRQELNQRYSAWMQLDDFLVYIGNNTKFSPRDCLAHAKRMAHYNFR